MKKIPELFISKLKTFALHFKVNMLNNKGVINLNQNHLLKNSMEISNNFKKIIRDINYLHNIRDLYIKQM